MGEEESSEEHEQSVLGDTEPYPLLPRHKYHQGIGFMTMLPEGHRNFVCFTISTGKVPVVQFNPEKSLFVTIFLNNTNLLVRRRLFRYEL